MYSLMAILGPNIVVTTSPKGFDVQTPGGGMGGSTPGFFRSGS